jgi:signal transduction histidine kinase
MSEQGLSNLFRHGYTTKRSGSGFGLHSAANFINGIGGTINAESDGVGRGAQFCITLPRKLTKKSTSK